MWKVPRHTEASTGRCLNRELGWLFGALHVRPQLVGCNLCFVRHSGLWVWSLILCGRPCDCHVIVHTLSCDDIRWELVTEKRDEMLCWILLFSSTEIGGSETACQGTASQASIYTHMHTQLSYIHVGLYTVQYEHGSIYRCTCTE